MPVINNGDDETAYADGVRVPICNDHSEENFLHQMAAKHGTSEKSMMEILQDADAHYGNSTGGDYAKGWADCLNTMRTGALIVMGYKKNQLFCFQCFLLVMHWFSELGCEDQVQLAKKWGVKKAAVNKCVGLLKDRIGPKLEAMKPMGSQRTAEASARMRESRINQLRK